MFDVRAVRNLYSLCCLAALAACSNGRGSVDSEPPPPSGGAQESFTVSGTVAGLDGDGLVLQLNDGNDLAVTNNGSFTFNTRLADDASYSVEVLTQPTGPSQTCTISNASGTVDAANVANVMITCATGAFALRGAVSGLVGSGLVLQNNEVDELPINNDGEFQFPTPYASGAGYRVTVKAQPSGPAQSCTVANGVGTIGSADVTNVAVSCATGTFSISVTVSGLTGGGLLLRNNGRDDLSITGNGSFQFREPLASGARYDVRVARSPTNPTQSCSVSNGSGTVAAANVANITVTCMTNNFTIGGPITGLEGTGLRLRLNNEPPFNVGAGARDFTFPTLLPSGSSYAVDVVAQPSNPAQECRLDTATRTGVVPGANVTNVAVTCTTRSFRIGGSISGLRGDGLILVKHDGETRAIASSGSYFFENLHLSGSQYEVRVQTQPTDPSQTCTIANNRGTVGSGDVSNVNVTCATDTFSVGGTVTGLLGGGLVLQNNGRNNLDVLSDGAFAFTEELASDSEYNVQVLQHPSNPTQTCSVVDDTGDGRVTTADITSVLISCSTANFTVGGTITNLVGTGLVLQNNGGDDLRIDAGSSFEFQTGVPSGAQYNVTVAAQPTGPAQQCDLVDNTGTGTVTNANVSNVQINCVTTEFTIGGTVSGLIGSQLHVQLNGGTPFPIAADGPYTFPTSLPNGTSYTVTIAQNPVGPAQICTPSNFVGIVNGADVENVDITCITSPF
jgi:large repetitive protein